MDNCELLVCAFGDGPVWGDLEISGIHVDVLGPRRYGVLALPWFIADMVHIRRKAVVTSSLTMSHGCISGTVTKTL
jgi:hypothetical protein